MKSFGLLICALATVLGAPDSAAAGHRRDQGPPPWAPAHGYRDNHERRHHGHEYHHKRDHKAHHHSRHRDDRRELRWRVPADRWRFREQDSALIAGVIGGAIGSLLTGPETPPPHHAIASPWAPPQYDAAPVSSFSSLGDGRHPSPGRYCREFSRDALISGRPQEIYGVACWQPDGSWEVVSVDRR